MLKTTKKKFLFLVLIAIVVGGIYTGVSYFKAGKQARLHMLVVEQDLPSLVKNSTAIAIGTIKGTFPSQISTDKNTGDKIVFTDYILSLDKTLKGDINGDIKIRTIGGTVGEGKNRFSMFAEDEPEFTENEHVLLFLSKNSGGFFDLSPGYYVVEGRFQGKYQIIGESAKDTRRTVPLNQLESEINSALQAK